MTGQQKRNLIEGTARTTINRILLAASLMVLTGGMLSGQQIKSASSEVVSYDEVNAPEAPDIIFSNLDLSPSDRYNTENSFPIAGKDAVGETESSSAILIIPKVDVQAKEIFVALGYVSGTKLVNVGLYSDSGFTHTVGDPLPGGQATITKMPDDGDCCRLAKVVLPGEGVFLSAGVFYWLAITPDDVNASSFLGAWRLSNRAAHAALLPPSAWRGNPGQWPAAQIRGTKVMTSETAKIADREQRSSEITGPAANVTIFTNLGPTSDNRYDMFNSSYVAGKHARDSDELWLALPFVPRANVHARTLAAAITYVSGTKLINLGIYSDNDGVPGSPLPGGQGSTTEIADAGELTQVTLPDPGLALQKGVRVWLVASPDNHQAPDFEGVWHESNLAVFAFEEPEQFISWTSATGDWMAARIEGTSR